MNIVKIVCDYFTRSLKMFLGDQNGFRIKQVDWRSSPHCPEMIVMHIIMYLFPIK